MNAQALHSISQRLSLRPPQAQALAKLAQALAAAPGMLQHERDVAAILATLKAEFPALDDFERAFPSLCFALATGVGKTRLMGAFVAYLHLAYGVNNFFVLAPNLTIYEKLIKDFTPNTAKYVFKGIGVFARNAPRIITGDNYEQQNITGGELFGDVRINIFNISKLNTEMRGGKEPRIKRMREVLGESYFNHLANLPDLVLLMDESHRYRASAGVRTLNELRPLLGLELTATPFVETSKGPVAFKNVVMAYPLARAMADGFVKEPAVVTQRNFDPKAHTAEDLERIKLQDGVRVHEVTKVELITYARENGVAPVKPFMLVIARDTTHAALLRARLESRDFCEGRYAGKVIQVDSSKSGQEEEAMIARLLAVEQIHEPTEIVIHVNMLKEGWDVTNLYTIVPLRAAHARTLIEQSIGRGLRLPYGQRTGVAAVDRLNIIAHDRFQEIIDEANRGDSPIRLQQVMLDASSDHDNNTSLEVPSGAAASLGLADALPAAADTAHAAPLLTTDAQKQAARVVLEVIGEYETQNTQVPCCRALLKPAIQQAMVAEVAARLKPVPGPVQGGLLAETEETLDIAQVVATTTQTVVRHTIDIPRIALVPKGEVRVGFQPFTLDLSGLHLQPGGRELVIHHLNTNTQETLAAALGLKEQRPEDYIVFALLDFEEIDYLTQSDLLYALAGQLVRHLRSYLSEQETHRVLQRDRRLIARNIHAQMMAHFFEDAAGFEVHVSRGFTQLKPCHYTLSAHQAPRHFRRTVEDPSRIKSMLFGGFEKCLYPLQKFDSDSERRFAVILERDAEKWCKPVKGQFQLYYSIGHAQSEYLPDFVVETDTCILLAETKRRDDLGSDEVKAKTAAALRWCQHATDYAASVGGKPWRYVLIPHDEVLESTHLADFLRFAP